VIDRFPEVIVPTPGAEPPEVEGVPGVVPVEVVGVPGVDPVEVDGVPAVVPLEVEGVPGVVPTDVDGVPAVVPPEIEEDEPGVVPVEVVGAPGVLAPPKVVPVVVPPLLPAFAGGRTTKGKSPRSRTTSSGHGAVASVLKVAPVQRRLTRSFSTLLVCAETPAQARHSASGTSRRWKRRQLGRENSFMGSSSWMRSPSDPHRRH
jgi:hypothetical protein